jgi:hypothetical protein
MMQYHLWDTEVGKYLGRFDDEAAALEKVRILVDHYGRDYAESLALGREGDDGTVLEPLAGDALLARAAIHVAAAAAGRGS